MSNPHTLIPRRTSPSQDDSPTPNIAEYIKSIPSWSPEEQQILEENMKHYPSAQNAEFKRLTLLMTNLPNKRLRDVSLRVKYMKMRETQDIGWESFLHNKFGQQKVELSPSHSVKSPRATPIERDEEPKRGRRTPLRLQTQLKKEEEDLSMSSNSNQVSSINSSAYHNRERDGNSMSMSSNATPLPYNQQQQLQPAIPPMQQRPLSSHSMMSHSPYPPQRSMYQSNYPQSAIGRSQVMYPQRDRMMYGDPQSFDALLAMNERCIESITNALFSKRTDFAESANIFTQNINKLLYMTNQMTDNLPPFFTMPVKYNPSVYKKLDTDNSPPVRSSPSYNIDFMVKNPSRELSIDGRRDVM
ncbi:Myb-like domain-containing protein [Entamoeba marina]